jgi:hemerythrin-like domain-containing protein
MNRTVTADEHRLQYEEASMTWRSILEREHRLLTEVLNAAEKECDHIEASGCCRVDVLADIIEFFRYFGDGLHDPKEEGLLFARCYRRGMTDQDEPLEQILGEHEWMRGAMHELQTLLDELKAGDTSVARPLAKLLREYIEVNRLHIKVEEEVFYETAVHYLTEKDNEELTAEFEEVNYDEVEEGVQAFYEQLAHRVRAAEQEVCG